LTGLFERRTPMKADTDAYLQKLTVRKGWRVKGTGHLIETEVSRRKKPRIEIIATEVRACITSVPVVDL